MYENYDEYLFTYIILEMKLIYIINEYKSLIYIYYLLPDIKYIIIT